MNRRTMTGAGVFAGLFVTLLLGLPAAQADDAADRCAADKLKAAGRYGQGALGCQASGVKRDAAVDSNCLVAAFGKLSSSFLRAEDRGDCVTNGDASTVGSAIDSDVNDFLALITYDDVTAARTCAAAKLKAAGKYFAERAGCYSKAAKKHAALDSACLTKAEGKLSGAFAKAELRGGCTIEDDDSDAATLGETSVTDVVASISPLCGDDVVGPTQVCDGTSDSACPSLCQADCTCFVPPTCDNGIAEFPEECDDGNLTDGDGCSSTCVLENTSALCDGVASNSGTTIDAVLLTDGIDQPIYVTAPPLDPKRLFIVEKPGRIRIFDLTTNTLLATPFLNITSLVSESGEQGLLSMAFDPNFEVNGRFFVYYTNNGGDEVIARYTTGGGDPNVANAGSGVILLTVDDPYENHNGGQLQFGADGYLYAGLGDGGGGGDPDENAQDDAEMLGKMLRMDVSVSVPPYYVVPPTNPHYIDGTHVTELIWAKGVRNPWRFSFDRANGDLIIADVGQNAIEEVDYQPAASTGGENYGWDIFEADTCFEPDPAPMCPSPPTGFTFPIAQYTHSDGCSITGGFVYRGCAMPDLRGTYFYSDYCTPFFRTFEISGGVAVNPQDRTSQLTPVGASIDSVVSFGQDARGELYICDIDDGEVFRIVHGS